MFHCRLCPLHTFLTYESRCLLTIKEGLEILRNIFILGESAVELKTNHERQRTYTLGWLFESDTQI